MIDRDYFFDTVRGPLFGGSLNQDQVDRIGAVLNGLDKWDVTFDRSAYILATAHHESDTWKTLEEYASGAAYEGRKDLGNTQPGDGKRFKGRGLVQITGRRNYTDWGGRLSVDLVGKPELAMELNNAVPILIQGMMLGTFTGKSLPDYVNDSGVDYVNARRVVNGTDKAEKIAGYATKYRKALKKNSNPVEPVEPDNETKIISLLTEIRDLLKTK